MNLENYEPVAVRLDRWLKAIYDQGKQPRVITHLEHYLADTAVFRAELYVDDLLVATGWEEEIRGSSPVNRTSHLANAETGAVGRALANAGLAGTDPAKRPSREEMQKVQRAGGDAAGGAPQAGPGEASPAQLGKIRALAKSLGKTPPIGYEAFSKREASAAIEALIAESQAQEDPF